MPFERILERTLAAEAAGFDSIWLMDHFAAPMAPEVDTFEGWTVATALAAHTSTIRIGHLVLCDPFRHPVLLAKIAASFDVISNGRLELGIGWGSVPDELHTYGFGPEPPKVRAAKLRETLEIIELMFTGEAFDYDGRALHAARRDRPARAGAGARADPHRWRRSASSRCRSSRDFADWWNCPGYALDRLDESPRPRGQRPRLDAAPDRARRDAGRRRRRRRDRAPPVRLVGRRDRGNRRRGRDRDAGGGRTRRRRLRAASSPISARSRRSSASWARSRPRSGKGN